VAERHPASACHRVDPDNAKVAGILDVNPAERVHADVMRLADLSGAAAVISVTDPSPAGHIVDTNDPVIGFIGNVNPALRIEGHALGFIELSHTASERSVGHQ